jgi:hypothetical protein
VAVSELGRQTTMQITCDARTQLLRLERSLVRRKRFAVFGSADWKTNFPPAPGVYAIWDKGSSLPVYVGQTSNIKGRMGDLGRLVNHTFRQKAAKLLRLTSGDEGALSEKMSKRFVLAFVPVTLGRIELEDYLRLRWQHTLYNQPPKRLLRSKQYDWVKFSNNSLHRKVRS